MCVSSYYIYSTSSRSFSDAIFCAWDWSSSAANSQAARYRQKRQCAEWSCQEDFVEVVETVDSAAWAAGSFMGIGAAFSRKAAAGQCLNCKMCDESRCAMKFAKQKAKNPGQTSWSGLTTDVYVHAVGVRKGESYRLTVR